MAIENDTRDNLIDKYLKNKKQNFQTNILKYRDTLLVRTYGQS